MSACHSHPLSSIYLKYLERELDIYLSSELLSSFRNEQDNNNKHHHIYSDVVVVFEWVVNKVKEIEKSIGFRGIEKESGLFSKLESFFSIMRDKFNLSLKVELMRHTTATIPAAKENDSGDLCCRLMPQLGINSVWPYDSLPSSKRIGVTYDDPTNRRVSTNEIPLNGLVDLDVVALLNDEHDDTYDDDVPDLEYCCGMQEVD
jgi:hypothetical protein